VCVLSSTVLLTGGNGFLGSHVQDALRSAAWVSSIAAPPRAQYDLLKEEDIQYMYTEHQPDIVIHLAALVGGIGVNAEHPAQFFYDNLYMGMQNMHYAWRHGVQKFVCIGTICSYPKNTPIPFRESDLWNGYPEETNAPYGIAKKALLTQAQAYRQEYSFNCIYLLPVNMYGPGDNFDLHSSHVIPAMIRKFVEAKEQHITNVTLWGDGTPTREFLFVEDAARAIVLAAEKYNEPDPMNIGTGQEISMKDLAILIARVVGYDGKIQWDTGKPNGQLRRCLDVSRAEKALGFRAQVSLEEGIGKTVQWFKEKRKNIREVHCDSV